jgi:hypothetical protein
MAAHEGTGARGHFIRAVELARKAHDRHVEAWTLDYLRARLSPALQDMTGAWTDAFRDLETVPPLTTSATEDGDGHGAAADDERTGTSCEPRQDRAAARVKRAEPSRSAIPSTPLAATGLSPYALSAALQKLNVSTAGELAAVPAAKITRLRGIGFPHRAVTSPWLVAEVPASPDRHTGERHLHVDHVYVATAERSRPIGHAEHEVRWFTPLTSPLRRTYRRIPGPWRPGCWPCRPAAGSRFPVAAGNRARPPGRTTNRRDRRSPRCAHRKRSRAIRRNCAHRPS